MARTCLQTFQRQIASYKPLMKATCIPYKFATINHRLIVNARRRRALESGFKLTDRAPAECESVSRLSSGATVSPFLMSQESLDKSIMASKISPFTKLISPSAAAKLLAGPFRVVPVDATWYMPNSPHNASEQFHKGGRIPGSIFFDLDKVCDADSPYPHMLPSQEVFNSSMAQSGVRESDHVLVYDRSGIFSGPRAAWTFSLYGHKNVYLLDHYKQFKEEFDVDNRDITDKVSSKTSSPSEYVGVSQEEFSRQYHEQVIEFEELKGLVESGQLEKQYFAFDARAKGRFTGEDPEPRKGLSSGHVPGSLSLPFSKVLNSEGHYKTREELVDLFRAEFDVDLTRPLSRDGIIVMCGTGVSAVILQTAIHKVSPDIPVRVYDGSWTEWAQRAPGLIEKS